MLVLFSLRINLVHSTVIRPQPVLPCTRVQSEPEQIIIDHNQNISQNRSLRRHV